jgi:hypothetical protein
VFVKRSALITVCLTTLVPAICVPVVVRGAECSTQQQLEFFEKQVRPLLFKLEK